MAQSGWNRQGDEPAAAGKKGVAWKRGLVCGLLVVAGSVAAWLALSPASKVVEKPKVDKPREIKAVEPAKVSPTATKEPKKPEVSREERLFAKTNGYVKAAGKMLTDDGRTLSFEAPKEGEFRTVYSHGKVYQCDSNGNFEDVTPKPIFKTAFENNLVGMAVEGGFFMPGMLTGYNQDEIAALLVKKVEISPDDPPDVVAKKEAVAALKQDIMDYIKAGGTFDEYVTEMRAQTVRERSLKTEGLKEIVKMLKDGDAEGAAMFRKKFDELAAKQGMRPLKLPSRIADALGDNQGNGK